MLDGINHLANHAIQMFRREMFSEEAIALTEPLEILRLVLSYEGVVQTSALGPSGLVISHMISTLTTKKIPIVFIDTLYHFNETLDLLQHVKDSGMDVRVVRPQGADTREEFETKYGKELWKTDPDSYDFLCKAEPGRRAYLALGAKVVITGRRRSQGDERSGLGAFEWDKSFNQPILKVNPLAFWKFDQVWEYIRRNAIAYNPLHDRGYKSIGDIHSTQPTIQGQSEREGRWQGQDKTECGLHKDYFSLKMKAKQAAAQTR